MRPDDVRHTSFGILILFDPAWYSRKRTVLSINDAVVKRRLPVSASLGWRRRMSVVVLWLFIVALWLFIVILWLFIVDVWWLASSGIFFFLVSGPCWRSYGPFRMVSKYWQREKEILLVTTTQKAEIDKYQQIPLYTHSPGNSPPVWRLQKCLKYVQIHPKYIYKKWQKRANKECKNEQIYTQITAKTRYICSQSHKKSNDV